MTAKSRLLTAHTLGLRNARICGQVPWRPTATCWTVTWSPFRQPSSRQYQRPMSGGCARSCSTLGPARQAPLRRTGCSRPYSIPATDDGLLRRNPCRIQDAGLDRSPERSVLTLRQVATLADAIGPRDRALIVVAVSAVSGGVSWQRFVAAILTCGHARSGLNGP